MHSAFLRQSVFCPIFIWGPLKSQPAAEAVPGKLISVALVYFPLLLAFFFSHGVGLSATTGERLGDGSLSFWWALVSGGLRVLCGYSHLFLCRPEHSWPQSQLMGRETEALGIPTVNRGRGGAQ